MKIFQQLVQARENCFIKIAQREATPVGYSQYAPITKGPLVALAGLIVLGLIVPFYWVWRLALTPCKNHLQT